MPMPMFIKYNPDNLGYWFQLAVVHDYLQHNIVNCFNSMPTNYLIITDLKLIVRNFVFGHFQAKIFKKKLRNV